MPNCLDFGPDMSLLQDPALSHRVVKVFWVFECGFFFLLWVNRKKKAEDMPWEVVFSHALETLFYPLANYETD